VPVGAPLEVIVEDPNKTGSTVRVPIANLASDQEYDLRDLVLNR
jgi:hypothetical protein